MKTPLLQTFLMALICALQIVTLKASAGTYGDPVYSGPGSTYSSQYAPGVFSSSGGSYSGSANAMGSSGTASAQGPLTATFTWQPAYAGEAAPASAIITEYCSAGGSGYGQYSAPSATADNGLGTASTSSGYGYNINVSSMGYKYSVQSGNTLTVHCNPSTSITGTNCSISASITYTVTVDVPSIVLAGATFVHSVPSDNTSAMVPGILIGQGLSVSVITQTLASQSSFAWTIGGDPFLGFPHSDTVSGMTGPAEITSVTKALSGFTYAYRSIGGAGYTPPTAQTVTPQTISCTVQGLDPNGNNMSVPVTAIVQVYQPANQFAMFSLGTVSGHQTADGNNWLDAWNGSPPPGNAGDTTGGIWFEEKITDPPAFTAGGTTFGRLFNTQTVTPSNTWTDSNGVVTTDANNGKFCIDGGVQYGTNVASNGTTTYQKDGPGLQVFHTGTFDDTLCMYLMYKPINGTGVTLAKIGWSAWGTGTVTPGVPPNAPTWAYPPLSRGISADDPAQTSVLPTWLTANVASSRG